MPISKAERLMDLVIALLHSRYYRTAAWVRQHVAGYEDAASDDSFSRMFERDKQELRELGIPVETAVDGDGYRIRAADFALPPVVFSATEQAALAIAARLWDTSALHAAGESALRKLREGHADDDAPHDPALDSGPEPAPEGSSLGAGEAPLVSARIRTVEPAFREVHAALRARRVLHFDYRGAADRAPQSRSVQPWALVNTRGSWYMAGFDTDRRAPRTFRLSRMTGRIRGSGRSDAYVVPADLDAATLVAPFANEPGQGDALLRIAPGAAIGLRRKGRLLAQGNPGRENGYDDVLVPITSMSDMARRVAGHGAAVRVVDPPELRDAVIALLRGAADGA